MLWYCEFYFSNVGSYQQVVLEDSGYMWPLALTHDEIASQAHILAPASPDEIPCSILYVRERPKYMKYLSITSGAFSYKVENC